MEQMHINLEELFDSIPHFSHHEEAKEWFKERFGEHFLLRTADETDGEKTYYYHVVKDPQAYRRYMEQVSEAEHSLVVSDDHLDPLYSYSTVQISHNGEVEIII